MVSRKNISKRREAEQLVLPNLFTLVPFECSMNPHYETAGPESAARIDNFDFFQGHVRDTFIRSDFELLIALTYPTASYDDYKTLCDHMNAFFVFDNITDEQNKDGALVTANTYLMALKGEDCAQSNTPLYKYVSEFSAQIRAKNLPNFQRRFVQHHADYVNSVVREAECRTGKIQMDFDEFVAFRRLTSGARCVYVVMEFALGIDLPDEVFDNEAFQRMHSAAEDLIGLSNDLHSYRKERSEGQEWNNVLTVLANTKGTSIQEAANFIGKYYESLIETYTKNKQLIPSFGDKVDKDVKAYIRNMEDWIIGIIEWSFRSKRYFGDEHEKVRSSHVTAISVRAS